MSNQTAGCNWSPFLSWWWLDGIQSTLLRLDAYVLCVRDAGTGNRGQPGFSLSPFLASFLHLSSSFSALSAPHSYCASFCSVELLTSYLNCLISIHQSLAASNFSHSSRCRLRFHLRIHRKRKTESCIALEVVS